jgi:hypothetical protein
LQWLIEAFDQWGQRCDSSVMSKDVPQEWQPYYPDGPDIGFVGNRRQIIEMDLAGEYWGESVLPFAEVDYVARRWRHDRLLTARGAAGRISRGTDYAFDTPNEVNIYAFHRFLADETAGENEVYADWIEQRYGLAPAAPESAALRPVLRRSYHVGRKMYYTLGFWTLEKGSDVPTEARFPQQLYARLTSFYDPDFWPVAFSLMWPSEQTLADMWQEKEDAKALAEASLDEFATVAPALNPDDAADLQWRLELHRDCGCVWQYVADSVFRYQRFWLQGAEEQGAVLEDNAQKLEALADEIEAAFGAAVSPGNPARIRAFVADLRAGIGAQPTPSPYRQPAIADLAYHDLGGDAYRITWSTSEPMTSILEWGLEIPDYGAQAADATLTVDHQLDFTLPASGLRTVFRVSGVTADGAFIRSSDFWIEPFEF